MVLHRAGLRVDAGAEQPLRREEERSPPAFGVEAHHVVGEQPLVHGRPQLRRQRVPVVGLRPRDVNEVRGHDVRPCFPHQARGEVQVVVVEEDRRVGLTLELLERRSSQRLVDRHVSVAPGRVQLRPEVGSGPQAPEVVLQKPESRVRKHVVEAVVGDRIVCHQPQPVGGSVHRLLDERPALLRGYHTILVRHRARQPSHVVMTEQTAQRGDDTAAAAPRHPVPV